MTIKKLAIPAKKRISTQQHIERQLHKNGFPLTEVFIDPQYTATHLHASFSLFIITPTQLVPLTITIPIEQDQPAITTLKNQAHHTIIKNISSAI